MLKKKFLRIILAAIGLYAGWLAFQELGFRRYHGSVSPDGASGLREIEGVYHIHTRFSDGHAGVDELSRLASREKLDFLILADHGNPNEASLRSQGWKDGVLILAGSELSTSRGHLVALGFRPPAAAFSQRAEDAVPEILALGGFAVIAHPYSKVRWTWGDDSEYSGMEIINADTMFKNGIGRIWPYLPLLAFRSRIPLIKMLEHPGINIAKWDQRSLTAPIYGYFSADAHLYYRAMLSLLRLHVLVDGPLDPDFETARSQVYGALRRGRFFNAVEAVAEARGFRFRASGGGRTWEMGETAAGRGLTLEALAPFSFAREIRLIHDGRTIATSRGESLQAPSAGPGTYRVEVFLKERSPLGADIPWILSNPIYVRKD